jgi:hypothetical protein
MCGQRFELLTVKKPWGEDRVYFFDKKKRLRHLPTSWTDAAEPNAFVTIAAGRSAFRLDDLIELSELIRTLRARSVPTMTAFFFASIPRMPRAFGWAR